MSYSARVPVLRALGFMAQFVFWGAVGLLGLTAIYAVLWFFFAVLPDWVGLL